MEFLHDLDGSILVYQPDHSQEYLDTVVPLYSHLLYSHSSYLVTPKFSPDLFNMKISLYNHYIIKNIVTLIISPNIIVNIVKTTPI